MARKNLKISEVKEAMDGLTYMSSDPETRAVYDVRVRELNDIYSGQTTRYKEGLAEGIEKGRAEEKIAMAENFLTMGLSIEMVAQGTGLSIEEIAALKEDICAE